jgi:hypothetical protein
MLTDKTRALPLLAFAAFAATASPASADGLQPGYWKVTSTPEVNGAPAPPQEKMRCMSPADTADLDKTFSPEARTINSACERVAHEVTATTLTWRLQCAGQVTMDIAGAFKFETPQRYTAEVRTQFSLAGQTTRSRVTIEGERVGECP